MARLTHGEAVEYPAVYTAGSRAASAGVEALTRAATTVLAERACFESTARVRRGCRK